MKYDRWLRPKDPTLLAIALGFCAMFWVTPPWWKAMWITTPTEEPWMYLVLPQALAVLLLRPRTPLAWAAVVAAVFVCWPQMPAFRSRAALPWLWELLDTIAGSARDESVNRAAFWAVAAVVAALAVKAFGLLDWGTAVATAVVAMIGSLVVSEGLLWMFEILPPVPKPALRAFEVVAFLSPAVVLPVLLWRKWPRVVLWIGVPAAALALAAVLWVDEHRTTPRSVAVTLVLIAAGSLWSYVDSRVKRMREPGRGFEVLTAQA